MPDVAAISQGKWDVPHFTNKAKVNDIVSSAGFETYTIVQAPFYFENLTSIMAPSEMNGVKGWALPIRADAQVIHMGSINEFGGLVAGVFNQPAKANGRTLAMAAGIYSFNDVAAAYGTVLGEKLTVQQVPLEVFAGFFPGANELGQMFGYFEGHTYMGPNSKSVVDAGNELAVSKFPPLQTWLKANLAK